MRAAVADRRVTRRHSFKTPLRVRIWKSVIPERRTESKNLSERGIFYTTDCLLRVGTTVVIFLKMREEITAEATTEWQRAGRVEPINSSRGKPGIGVEFDCYQISWAKTA